MNSDNVGIALAVSGCVFFVLAFSVAAFSNLAGPTKCISKARPGSVA